MGQDDEGERGCSSMGKVKGEDDHPGKSMNQQKSDHDQDGKYDNRWKNGKR